MTNLYADLTLSQTLALPSGSWKKYNLLIHIGADGRWGDRGVPEEDRRLSCDELIEKYIGCREGWAGQ